MGHKVLTQLLLLSITSKGRGRRTATARVRQSMHYLGEVDVNVDVRLELGIDQGR